MAHKVRTTLFERRSDDKGYGYRRVPMVTFITCYEPDYAKRFHVKMTAEKRAADLDSAGYTAR